MNDSTKSEAEDRKLIQSWYQEYNNDEALVKTQCLQFCLTKDHLWCQHSEITKELLFFYGQKNNPDVKRFLDRVSDQMANCLDCTLKYRSVKKLQKDLLLSKYTEESVDALFAILKERDQERVLQSLLKFSDPNRDMGVLSTLLHECFHHPELLEHPTLRKIFLEKLDYVISGYTLTFGSPEKKVSGVFVMLMNEKKSIRQWALTNIKNMGKINELDDFQLIHPMFDKLIEYIQCYQKGEPIPSHCYFSDNILDIWSGISELLEQFTDFTFRNGLLSYFSSFLGLFIKELYRKTNSVSDELLDCFFKFFDFLQMEFWERSHTTKEEFVNVVCGLLLTYYDPRYHNSAGSKTKKSIKELLKRVLETCESEEEVFQTNDQIVGYFLSKSMNIKSTAVGSEIFVYVLDQLTNHFSTAKVSLWGKRLVFYISLQTFQSVVASVDQIPKAIKLLNKALEQSTFEMRGKFQLINHSLSKEEVDKELADPCEYWCKSIWVTLLLLNPKLIPYPIHETIFNTHRMLSLLSVPSSYAPGGSSTGGKVYEIYENLGEYQNLISQYLTTFTTQYKIMFDSVPHDPRSAKVDALDSPFFSKSILSFCVSPSAKIRDAFKKLLMKKFPNETVTMAFKESVKSCPADTLKGVLGLLRDLLIGFGLFHCLESINMIFYYINHLLFLLKNFSEIPKFLSQMYFTPIVDCLWPIAELFLSQPKYYPTIHQYGIAKPLILRAQDVKTLFEWIKNSFPLISNERYCSLKNSPLPSIVTTSIQNVKLPFTSVNMYPVYIRKPLQVEQYVDLSKMNQFEIAFEYYTEDLSNHYESLNSPAKVDLDSSIIYYYSLWLDYFICWDSKDLSPDWLDSLNTILKEMLKHKLKLNNSLTLLINSLADRISATQLSKLNAILANLNPPIVLSNSSSITNNINNNSSSSSNNSSSINNSGNTIQSKPTPPTSSLSSSSWSSKPLPGKDETSASHLSSSSSNKPIPPSNHSSNHSNNNNHHYSSGGHSNNHNHFGGNTTPKSMGGLSGKPMINKDDFNDVFDEFDRPIEPVALKDKKKTIVLDLGTDIKFKGSFKQGIPANDTDHYVPRIENLYKAILNWTPSILTEKDMKQLQIVPNTFNSYREYINIFEPLLLEEFKAQVIKNLDELDQTSGTPIIVDNLTRENDFHLIDFQIDSQKDDVDLLIDDLVAICKVNYGSSKWALSDIQSFGKIEMRERRASKRDKFIGTQKHLFIRVRFFQLDKRIGGSHHIKLSSNWTVQKITSLATISREYIALHSVGKIPLSNTILNPTTAVTDTSSYTIPAALKKALREQLNASQFNAINYSVSSQSGFTLLCGPPGTGKTKTIMSLLSVFLAIFKQLYNSGKSLAAPRILVCAPSNAAVDEIASRISVQGLLNGNAETYTPSAVRVGNLLHINPNVHHIALDNLIEDEMKGDNNNSVNLEQNKISNVKTKISSLFQNLEEYSQRISELNRALKTGKGSESHIKSQLNDLYYNKEKTDADLKKAKEEEKKANESFVSSKKVMVKDILAKCEIVLSTLSGSGYENLSLAINTFDLVIVDEAAQAIELSTLIPLRYDVKKCILVGDPNQLPPTIISKLAVNYQYEVSLFQRLQACKYPSLTLNVQYRMNPHISKFPSQHFYNNKLVDGENVKKYHMPFYEDPRFGPFIFYDIVDSSEESGSSTSLKNPLEARLANQILKVLFQLYPASRKLSIGAITPYKQQVWELKRNLDSSIEVNTVDGFQGKEKDIIIFSCVRAHKGNSIGFLSDVRRMNVGLTRAKYSMIIIGNSNLLALNPDWNDLIQYAKGIKNGYYQINSKSIHRDQLLPMDKITNITTTTTTTTNSSSSSSSSSNTSSTNGKASDEKEKDSLRVSNSNNIKPPSSSSSNNSKDSRPSTSNDPRSSSSHLLSSSSSHGDSAAPTNKRSIDDIDKTDNVKSEELKRLKSGHAEELRTMLNRGLANTNRSTSTSSSSSSSNNSNNNNNSGSTK